MPNLLEYIKSAISFEANHEGAVLRRFCDTYTVKRLRIDIFRFITVYEGEDESAALDAFEKAINQYNKEKK